jgi:hypothetical protein
MTQNKVGGRAQAAAGEAIWQNKAKRKKPMISANIRSPHGGAQRRNAGPPPRMSRRSIRATGPARFGRTKLESSMISKSAHLRRSSSAVHGGRAAEMAVRPNWDNSSDLNALPDPVTAGHSRSKDGVALLAFVPAIRVIARRAKHAEAISCRPRLLRFARNDAAARDCFVAYGSSQ